ncbi:MAG: VWA domain-containing protein [Curvibacter lanceolatus]|uniref:VWA domain-containing protein n=1 Tax=Curvibacter lanceolatus TaxID=86182 RepID=UPI002354C0EE|nr:VWA domain-containing protein [Curvibacter lanceolatus]MBV5296518.1 VWA domain-containing protein [Curvibacter lanceolatus]
MSFLWPQMLWLLALCPLTVAAYVWLLRRRTATLRYPGLALLQQAMEPGRRWRRHLPPTLLLLAWAVLLLAAARPVARISLPSEQQTLLLVMDVSGSMRATDVKPNRLVAAQEAAKAFIRSLPRQVRVGIVAFAGSAQLAQAPTRNHEDLLQAIEGFQLQRGTATGNGLVVALATLFPQAGIDLAHWGAGGPGGAGAVTATPLGSRGAASPPPWQPVPAGSYTSAAIIMLTDGQRTTGVDPLEAARLAAERGVRVYTVGVGTVDGETVGFEGWSMRVRLDEETLKAVAARTQGEYFHAASAEALHQVYENLSSRLALETHETEISALLALAAAALVLLATGLSLVWFGPVA